MKYQRIFCFVNGLIWSIAWRSFMLVPMLKTRPQAHRKKGRRDRLIEAPPNNLRARLDHLRRDFQFVCRDASKENRAGAVPHLPIEVCDSAQAWKSRHPI